MVTDIDALADVEAFLRSVADLLDEAAPDDAAGADPAARAAENHAVIAARARQARSRAVALGARVEGLWRRHEELRAVYERQVESATQAHEQAVGMLMVMFGLTASQGRGLLGVAGWRRDHSPESIARLMVAECERGRDPVKVLLDSGTTDRDRAPLVVRRAIAYIERNAADDITIDDICAAAGVGRRGLQHAFRRHCGMTPTRYLREIRLANAHRQLVAGDPTRGDTVSAIADAWRLPHHGRFAVDYRAAYGVTPTHTLRH